MSVKKKCIKLTLLIVVLSMMFLNAGCSKSEEEGKTTVNNNDNDSNEDEEASQVKLDTVDEICEYLVDKTWYSELEKVDNDRLFSYRFCEYTFNSDGTLECKEYSTYSEDDQFSMKWSLTEDKILEVYNPEGDVVELVYGEVTDSDTWKWKISEDTLSLFGVDYSVEEKKLPDFDEVFLTEHDEIEKQLVNSTWLNVNRDVLYEFCIDGTIMVTDYDEYGNEESCTGYWDLLSDNTLQISIDGSEMMSYKILTEEACENQEGDFSYYYAYWWMESDDYYEFRVGDLITVERYDENFEYSEYALYERVVNYIKYGGNEAFYSAELLSERDNILQTEPYKTILDNELYSYEVEGDIVTIYLDYDTKYQFHVELDDDTNKIIKLTYIDE